MGIKGIRAPSENEIVAARTSGHVKLRKGKRVSTWYLKYRLPDGSQVQQRLGPARSGRGRPPAGHFTRRMAEEALQEVLTDARRGDLDAPVSDRGHVR